MGEFEGVQRRFRPPELVCEDCGEASSRLLGTLDAPGSCARCGGKVRGKNQLALIEAGMSGSLEVMEVRCDGCGATRFSAASEAEREAGMPCVRPGCEGRRRLVGLAF